MSIKNSSVRKSNWLITASYKLTLNEQRLVLIAIAKIPFDSKEIKRRVVITAKEMLDCFPDIGEQNVHKEMRDAVDNLWERAIKVADPNRVDEFRWITAKSRYLKGEGRVGFSFSPEVLPYLQQLKEQFTKYRLGDIASLKSTYSIRLYEMLMQFQNTGIALVGLEEFKERLGISDKYADYRILRRIVIEPAVKELNHKSHFNVTFKGIREGRAIKNLEFFFSEK
jgi:plasmid replication initiation protein